MASAADQSRKPGVSDHRASSRRPSGSAWRRWLLPSSGPGSGSDAGTSTARVETFSDGVFAIAITLLVLNLVVPHAQETARLSASQEVLGSHLLYTLGRQWAAYVSFAISFVIVGVVWANHRVMFTFITRADHILIVLNTLLLMNVAFIPFPAAILGQYIGVPTEQKVAVMLYSATLVVGGVIYNLFWRYAVRAGLLPDDADMSTVRALSRRYLLGPVLYALAFGLTFLSSALGFAVCVALAVLYILPGFTHRV